MSTENRKHGTVTQLEDHVNSLLGDHLRQRGHEEYLTDPVREDLRALVSPINDRPAIRQTTEGLRSALAHQKIIPAFQLCRRIDRIRDDGRIDMSPIASAEALPRIADKARGILPTSSFLAVAAQSGLVGKLNEHLVREVLRQLEALNEADYPEYTFSLNLPESWLEEFDTDRIEKMMIEHRIWWTALKFEVMENIADIHPYIETLRGISQKGSQLYIDDYGMRNSVINSQVLHEEGVPIHAIKLPGESVSAMEDADNGVDIVAAVNTAINYRANEVVIEGSPGGLNPVFLARSYDVIMRQLHEAGLQDEIDVYVQGPLSNELSAVDVYVQEDEAPAQMKP